MFLDWRNGDKSLEIELFNHLRSLILKIIAKKKYYYYGKTPEDVAQLILTT
jgi:hypothetical protein